MASDPERDHALVNLAHLPGAGDDAATVDQGAHAVAEDVLLNQLLASQLACPVERSRPIERKALGDPVSENPADPGSPPSGIAYRFP